MIASISTIAYIPSLVDAVSCTSTQCEQCGCSNRCAPAGGTLVCYVSFCGYYGGYVYSYSYWNNVESVSWQSWKTGPHAEDYDGIGCTNNVDGCTKWSLCVTGKLTGKCCNAETSSCVSGTCKTNNNYYCSSDTNCVSGCCVSNKCVSSTAPNGASCSNSCECSTNNCPSDYDAGTKHCCPVGNSYNNVKAGCYKDEGQPCSTNGDCNSNVCFANTCILDTTPPTITDNYVNDNIWVNTDQTVTLNPQDADSGIKQVKYCTGAGCTPSTSLNTPYILTYNTEQNTNVRYQSWDNVDLSSIIGQYIVKIDKTPPTITDNYVNDNIWVNTDQTVTLNPQDTDSGIKQVKYCTGTGCSPSTSLSTPYTLNYNTEQNTIVRYQVWDNVDLSSIIGQYIVQIDKTQPTTTDNYGTKNDIWQSSDQTITLIISDPPISSGITTTKYCIDTVNSCIPSINYIAPVLINNEGTNYFRYHSTDNSGNVQNIISKIVKLDKSPPQITIESPSSITYDTQWIWFNITATDTYTSVNWCSFSLNGSANITLPTDTPDHYYFINKTVYVGDYEVTFYCNDTLGNMDSITAIFDVEYDCMLNEDLDPKCGTMKLCKLNQWITNPDYSINACCCISSSYWDNVKSCCDSSDKWLTTDNKGICSTGIMLGEYTGSFCSLIDESTIINVQTVFECDELEINEQKWWWNGTHWVNVAPQHCGCTQNSDCDTQNNELCMDNICLIVKEPIIYINNINIVELGEIKELIIEIRNDMNVYDNIELTLTGSMSNWAWFKGQKNMDQHNKQVIVPSKSTEKILVELYGGNTGSYNLKVSAESQLTLKYVESTSTIQIIPGINATGTSIRDTPGLSWPGLIIILIIASVFFYSKEDKIVH